MRPGHHQRRSELAARDVKHAAGGAVTIRTETGVVGILIRCPEHIVWRSKPGNIRSSSSDMSMAGLLITPVSCHVVMTTLLLEHQGQGLAQVPIKDVQGLILLDSWMEEAAVSSPDSVTLSRGPEVELALAAVGDHLGHVPHVLVAGHRLPLLGD